MKVLLTGGAGFASGITHAARTLACAETRYWDKTLTVLLGNNK